MKKKIAILGSTGSIGTQAVEVVQEHPDQFEIYALTANHNVELLIQQALLLQPEAVVIANEAHYPRLKEALRHEAIKVYCGSDAIAQIAEADPIDIVLTAMVGYAGLQPTIHAIQAGKVIALANKETLVVAGDLITRLALENHAPILPVDSEHSAIYQCLAGEPCHIEKIILTASGGPFRNHTLEQLQKVTRAQALRHPNWEMGAKITIDSATLMNKGFEVIEGKWLFDLRPDQVEVVVHPQSIIHSMVQFEDGSIKAQMGAPDMKHPIRFAFSCPYRLKSESAPRIDFTQLRELTFEQPDLTRFPNLAFAYEAMRRGGNMACILNAANEVAVDAFLHEQIGFLDISRLIERAMQRATFVQTPSYDDYGLSDTEVRRLVQEMIQ